MVDNTQGQGEEPRTVIDGDSQKSRLTSCYTSGGMSLNDKENLIG